MKKKSYAVGLGALAVALTLVTTSLVGGTLARYATEVTGSATATVAKWSFKAMGSDGTTTATAIDLGDTTHRTAYKTAGIKEGVIAPGTTGSFDIEIDGSGSEVGINYAIKIAKASTGADLPTGLAFKADGAMITFPKDITGTIAYDATADAMKKTVTVNWEWAVGDATKESNDNADQDKDLALDITITGTQVTPEATTP